MATPVQQTKESDRVRDTQIFPAPTFLASEYQEFFFGAKKFATEISTS